MTTSFKQEFHSLHFVLQNAKKVLLFAHTRPDADSVGATVALEQYLKNIAKSVDIACFDPFPEILHPILSGVFSHPDQLDLRQYDVIVAADSVDRGFDQIRNTLSEKQLIILIDHHPNIELSGDIVIIDSRLSSTCEILALFFESINFQVNKTIATALLAGIFFDTAGFHNRCTSPQVMEITSRLIKHGASLEKISRTIYTKSNLPALKLQGRAIEKARYYEENGSLVTAITQKDLALCGAKPEDVYWATSTLSTVPDIRFSLVLSERENGIVRGSLRTAEGQTIDVSAIAKQFGGGGHKLASGFEVKGRILETLNGWEVA